MFSGTICLTKHLYFVIVVHAMSMVSVRESQELFNFPTTLCSVIKHIFLIAPIFPFLPSLIAVDNKHIASISDRNWSILFIWVFYEFLCVCLYLIITPILPWNFIFFHLIVLILSNHLFSSNCLFLQVCYVWRLFFCFSFSLIRA